MLKTSTALGTAALFAEPVRAAAPPPTSVTPELIEAARNEGKISYSSALELNVCRWPIATGDILTARRRFRAPCIRPSRAS